LRWDCSSVTPDLRHEVVAVLDHVLERRGNEHSDHAVLGGALRRQRRLLSEQAFIAFTCERQFFICTVRLRLRHRRFSGLSDLLGVLGLQEDIKIPLQKMILTRHLVRRLASLALLNIFLVIRV
jgi:hypothetical protein